MHRAHRLLSESTLILCTLKNGPGRRQTAGDFTGKYSRADRVSDQGGGAETDTERRMSGTNEMRGKA